MWACLTENKHTFMLTVINQTSKFQKGVCVSYHTNINLMSGIAEVHLDFCGNLSTVQSSEVNYV